ncbi:MAG TPA: hypothetical protein VF221_09585, partial [Chloroflexota bacterium]
IVGDSATVTFNGRSYASSSPCFLRVTLLRRPYADSSCPDDRDIFTCEIAIQVDAFSGTYSTAIWGRELVRLRDVLAMLYQRVGQETEAAFTPLENAFELRFHLTPLGHLTTVVAAHGTPGMGPDLHFSVEADQSYIPQWIAEVDAAIARFPPENQVDVGTPE